MKKRNIFILSLLILFLVGISAFVPISDTITAQSRSDNIINRIFGSNRDRNYNYSDNNYNRDNDWNRRDNRRYNNRNNQYDRNDYNYNRNDKKNRYYPNGNR